jgi:dihydrodipicolinate synthase/N-acetylneuraminate lyase
MTREDPQLKLRLSQELKARVVAAARENSRSVNAEIVRRLEHTFDIKFMDASLENIKAISDMQDGYDKVRADTDELLTTQAEIKRMLTKLMAEKGDIE